MNTTRDLSCRNIGKVSSFINFDVSNLHKRFELSSHCLDKSAEIVRLIEVDQEWLEIHFGLTTNDLITILAVHEH